MNELVTIAHKWFDIGIQLGISYHVLKGFEQQHKDNPYRCLSEMLHCWLNGNGNCCVKWETIVEAIRSPSINETGLAERIFENNLLQPAASECYSPSALTQGTYMYTCIVRVITPHACVRSKVLSRVIVVVVVIVHKKSPDREI